jgi:hypothetical protein
LRANAREDPADQLEFYDTKRKLPNGFHAALGEKPVSGYKRQPFFESLRSEHSVEGIFVQMRKIAGSYRMPEVNGQNRNVRMADLLEHVLADRLREGESASPDLNRYFPNAGDAEQQRFRLADFTCARRKLVWLSCHPEERMRVDEEPGQSAE